MALQYDDIATNHMLYILYPLVGGYAVYSLMYDRHRSWYSWVLSSLTGFVYTFGFIQVRWAACIRLLLARHRCHFSGRLPPFALAP